MKRLPCSMLLVPALLLAGCASMPAPDPAELRLPDEGRVAVSWNDPAKFREFSCRMVDHDAGWVEDLARHARTRAERSLPPEARLELHFVDIDRAGECEPIRSAEERRVLRDVTPPRIELDYRLVTADGHVSEQKGVRLTDLSYLQRSPVLTGNETLRHEKRLLDDWLRRLADGR
ncbi:DUF3016 domain-containing protein [Luteimonas sp. e5]